MSWVLGRGGLVLYKAMWTSAARIGEFFARQGVPGAGRDTFHTEQLEIRQKDIAAFYAGLERNGPRAVTEFGRAEEIWAERARAAAHARRGK